MTISAAEQLLIELLNRARLDPFGEAARHGLSDLNQNLAAGTISGAPSAVLSPNVFLEVSAEGHSQWMLATDTFSHTGEGNTTPTNRMVAAGYVLTGAWRTGENIAFSGTTGTIDLDTEISQHHKALFLSAGHRVNILSAGFKEIGVSQVQGVFTSGTTYNASMLTENFARTGTTVFLTGVTYSDLNGDDFYSIGEAGPATTFTIGTGSASTAAAGGYGLGVALAVATAATAVTVTQGAFFAQVSIDLSAGNAKLDLVDGLILETSAHLTLVSGASSARALGTGNITLTGSASADRLEGNVGTNHLTGNDGQDTLVGGLGDDTLNGGAGGDVLDGGAGIDTASYQRSTEMNVVDLLFASVNKGSAMGDSFFGIENLLGGDGIDHLRGTDGVNVLQGGAGADVIYGRRGDDTLSGDAGSDVLVGGAGADLLAGGSERDQASYHQSRDALLVDLLQPGLNTFEAAGDRYDSIEDLTGGSGSDRLYGDHGVNRVTGREGADWLFGRQGNDYLYGGTQADRLDGGMGNDWLFGGADADLFVFTRGADAAQDFSLAEADRIAVHRSVLGNLALNAAELMAYASLANGAVVFDFGAGNTLTLHGVSTLAGLEANLFSF